MPTAGAHNSVMSPMLVDGDILAMGVDPVFGFAAPVGQLADGLTVYAVMGPVTGDVPQAQPKTRVDRRSLNVT